MIVGGTSYTFSTVAGVASTSDPNNNYYGIVANNGASPIASLIINLYGSATPADGSTFTVSAFGGAGNTNPIMSADGKTYTAVSGTVTCNIVGGKVRISFSNISFKNITDATDIKTVSAMATVL
jgi:hypothetical protein